MNLFLIQNTIDSTKSDLPLLVGTAKDIFQILFFILAGVIAILTYLQAKKSLFTPIKTETFKIQISAFEQIIQFFQNKSETDFTGEFDLNKILDLNSHLMFKDFLENFFSEGMDKEKAKKNIEEINKNFYGAIMTHSFAAKYFETPEYYDERNKNKKEEELSPVMLAREWDKYEYGKINFTVKFFEKLTQLKYLAASPVIPEELMNMILEFHNKVNENLNIVGSILTEVAKELPDRFKTLDTISNFNTMGIWNIYNRRKNDLEPLAKNILEYIKRYLKIEEIVQ